MGREEVEPGLYQPDEDLLGRLRDTASAAARNMGLAADVQQVSPEHWQRVLLAVETRMRMRGVPLPESWREDLAEQMGRSAEASAEPES